MPIGKSNKQVSADIAEAPAAKIYGSDDGGTTWNPIAVDSNGDIITSNVGSPLVSGRKTVSTAGTAEVLKTDTALTQGILIMALKDNTNNVFVGDSNVDKTTNKQTELEPGESYAFAVNNTNLIYVDVTTNGEGVSFAGV